MMKGEHTEQLATPVLGIVSVNVAHMKLCMRSETSHHVLCEQFLGDIFEAGLAGVIAASPPFCALLITPIL